MLWLSLINLVFLVYYLPLENKLDNAMEIVNELFIYAAICHFIIFSDLCDDTLFKYDLGWSLAMIIVLQILVNTIVMTVVNIHKLFISRKLIKETLVRYYRLVCGGLCKKKA